MYILGPQPAHVRDMLDGRQEKGSQTHGDRKDGKLPRAQQPGRRRMLAVLELEELVNAETEGNEPCCCANPREEGPLVCQARAIDAELIHVRKVARRSWRTSRRHICDPVDGGRFGSR